MQSGAADSWSLERRVDLEALFLSTAARNPDSLRGSSEGAATAHGQRPTIGRAVEAEADADDVSLGRRCKRGNDSTGTLEQRAGIVELHHHVLPYLLNATLSGLLPPPGEGAATLLHLDSHGDMQIPPMFFNIKEIYAQHKSHPARILDYTKISDWVPAAMLLGLVSRVIFVEPPWGIEFVVRPHRSLLFTVGDRGGEFVANVRTPSGEDVSKVYERVIGAPTLPIADISNAFEVAFELVPLHELQSTVPSLLRQPRWETSPVYLSVDLDVFGTESPPHLENIQLVRTRRRPFCIDHLRLLLHRSSANGPCLWSLRRHACVVCNVRQ